MKIFGITGWKDAGKTTLAVGLIETLTARGLRVASVKHAHAGFDIDHPGRDSHRHRVAGAAEVLVASPRRWALIHELGAAPEPPLEALLGNLAPADVILVEGYKAAPHPKLEVIGTRPPIAATNPTIRATAGPGGPPALPRPLPHFDRDALPAIADFVLAELGL